MNSLFRSVSLYIALFLAAPTFLILISWNALPGERLYGLKRGLEAGPRLAFGNTRLAADYEVVLTDRRFIEAKTLVKRNDVQGLNELTTSIQLASNKVVSIDNTEAKTKLINNLITYNQQLEQQKRTLAATPTVNPTPTAALPNPIPAPTPQPAASTTPPASTNPATTNPTTVQVIDNTQKIIQQTIDDLEKGDKDKDTDKDRNKNGNEDKNKQGNNKNDKNKKDR